MFKGPTEFKIDFGPLPWRFVCRIQGVIDALGAP